MAYWSSNCNSVLNTQKKKPKKEEVKHSFPYKYDLVALDLNSYINSQVWSFLAHN